MEKCVGVDLEKSGIDMRNHLLVRKWQGRVKSRLINTVETQNKGNLEHGKSFYKVTTD
jgi:hypothetical protein